MTTVRPYAEVVADAKRDGQTMHFGTVFPLMVVKGQELPEGHALRKYKGRVVFRGNDVRDEDNEHAIFNDGGYTASLMSASKACDATALLPNCSGEQSDAVAAYTGGTRRNSHLGKSTARSMAA